MKNTLLSCLAVALVASAAPLTAAKDDASDTRPVVVAAFSGYGELKRDLEYLGTLSGNPDMAKGLEGMLSLFTQGQGLAGLDQARPWGAAVSVTEDNSEFPALAFVPVTDLKQLLDSTAALLGEADEAGDNVYEIRRGSNTFYVTQKGKWAYIAQKKGDLGDLPSDPLKQLRGLDKKYDLAVSVFVQNIPQGLRDTAAELIKQGLEANLQQNADDDDEQAELKAQIARGQAEAFVKGINEMDQITIGLNIDRKESRTFLDIVLTAVEGSEIAKQLASSGKEAGPSKFAAVLRPDAIFSLHVNSPVSGEDEEQMEELLKGLNKQLMSEIDDEDDLNNEQKEKSKELVEKVLDIVEETLEEKGRINAGLTVVGSGPITVALGVLVDEVKDLEDVVKQFVTMAAEEADLPKPKWNAEKYKGYRFHALNVPVSDDDENAEKIEQTLGDPVKVTFAFGEDTFYLAAGDEGVETIKQLIDKSAETPDNLPPVTASVALAPLMKLVASQDGNRQAGMMAQMLQQGKDRIKITLEAIDNGVRYRFEAEEGVNKLLGAQMGGGLRGGF